jgi:hypothetical protein
MASDVQAKPVPVSARGASCKGGALVDVVTQTDPIGRPALRRLIFQAAFVSAFHNPSLRSFADRLRKAGKPHTLIITAVARNLVTITNTPRKNRQNWAAKAPLQIQLLGKRELTLRGLSVQKPISVDFLPIRARSRPSHKECCDPSAGSPLSFALSRFSIRSTTYAYAQVCCRS